MKNFVQDGKAVEVTAPAAATAGEPVEIGSLVGIAVEDAGIGEPVVILTEGVFSLPADAGVAAGDKVEWDGSQVVDLAAGEQIGVAVTSVSGGTCDVKVG